MRERTRYTYTHRSPTSTTTTTTTYRQLLQCGGSSRLVRLTCVFCCIYLAVFITSMNRVRKFQNEASYNLLDNEDTRSFGVGSHQVSHHQRNENKNPTSIPNNKDSDVKAINSNDVSTRKEIESMVITLPKVGPMKSVRRQLDDIIVLQSKEISPLENCSPTAQVKIHISKQDEWILQTFDDSGQAKHLGGDEFYITYTDGLGDANNTEYENIPPTCVAIIQDKNDGTYSLNFSTTPMNPNPINLLGRGRLTIHYEYTCGIGMMPQPTKQHWKNSGAVLETFHRNDVPLPPMTIFEKPIVDDLSHWPLVVFFGDSTMLQMIKDGKAMEEAGTEENIFLKNNTFFHANIRTEFRMDRLDLIQKKFQAMHRKQMLKYEFDVAIVVGSAIWDVLIAENIQGRDFEDHLAACRDFLTDLKKRYFGRKIYWKSPSALQMHRVKCIEANYEYQECLDSTRYLSNSRVRLLHEKQKELMKELNVAYLDLFDSYYLSAHYTAEGDGRHFRQEVNEVILDWFYPKNQN